MSAVLDEGAKVKTKTSPAVQCLATFLIGVFAGVCAVFVPRLGGLLVIQDMERITVFPAPFILLGMAYATIVGAIAAILYYEKAGTPGERFMTALGLPARVLVASRLFPRLPDDVDPAHPLAALAPESTLWLAGWVVMATWVAASLL